MHDRIISAPAIATQQSRRDNLQRVWRRQFKWASVTGKNQRQPPSPFMAPAMVRITSNAARCIATDFGRVGGSGVAASECLRKCVCMYAFAAYKFAFFCCLWKNLQQWPQLLHNNNYTKCASV